ncbi:MAG: nucleoside:proton symporter [Betaproteobacteria bacterium]|nr:nucleoside:proton symporter [Betaproteobacteria bacterium]NBP09777.1 nucleoside:proton symporter [Betaproteobacteria bacterium]NBS20547.1 nucleoside:proton symporter [Betaproteobacteria bacterium]NBT64056.1 nucleoside:proton symporter [Betaproteobacteria bacterium]NBU67219.1 nucleoside:proton symporter [Betaproteobacteria bacterium]
MTTSFQAALGIVLFMALVLPFSKDPRRISLRLVLVAIALQFLLCWLMLKAPLVKEALLQLNLAVSALGAATMRGSSFVFGYLGGGQTPFSVSNPNSLVVFAFQVLPLLIVMSAISALLWYWRILPVLIRSIALIFERTLGVRGPAGLVSTANIFLGQTEAPLLVKPYLATMSRHELLLVMTAGMATIAGSVMVIYAAMLGDLFQGAMGHLITKSVMAVPASVLFAHLLIPADEGRQQALQTAPRIYESTMDAITRGTTDGLSLYLNIIAILIVLTALVALANGLISFLPGIGGAPLTLERVAGWIFAPIAWCMGIEWAEAGQVGALLGIKSILNEFIAYIQLSAMPREALSDRSRLITSYALCGFANLASIGIQISGIGTMAPERRSDLVDLAWPAFLAATLASCMNASVVAIVAG